MLTSTRDLGPGAILGQGVYQDEKGRAYKHVYYPASKQMDRVLWTIPPLSTKTLQLLTPVVRESKSALGTSYNSLQCFVNREI